jgi:hypothetical protein
MFRMLVLGVTLTFLGGAGAAIIIPPPLPPPSVAQIADSYSDFDLDGDGVLEINSLSLMDFEPATPLGGSLGLAIVLVDPRLLQSSSPELNATVRNHLINHRDDLVREGYSTRFLLADVYRGVQHQDGRTLLAIRRFLNAVRASYPSLRGVTLVGSFPEATLFRRVLFRSVENGKQYLVLHPERINPRADIVLSDLDGNWESLYQLVGNNENLKVEVPNNVVFPRITWPFSSQTLTGTVRTFENVQWQDIFYLHEDYVDRLTSVSGIGAPVTVRINSTAQRHPELTAADRSLANPIARPEIMVSRIDARGVAVNPVFRDRFGNTLLDRFGNGPLDANGRPQAVEFERTTPYDFNAPAMQWRHDPLLEQRVIADYFDRNHSHRLGVGHASQYRTSGVTEANSGLRTPWEMNQELRKADPTGLLPSLEYDQANMFMYIMSLREPSVLRGIAAHSTGLNSTFADVNNPALIELAVGGTPFAWVRTSNNGRWQYTPSAAPIGGSAEWSLARSLWTNRTLMFTGQSFYIHEGCSITVPDENWPDVSYDDLMYGFKNNADSILLYQNGLALMGRGKVFYDTPAGFTSAISSAGGRFGYGWRGMFTTDGNNAALKPGTNADSRVLNNKKSYFWDLRGDWTVKLKY